MKKLKIGVLGLYRGSSMINYCEAAENAEIVAICDKWEDGIRRQKEALGDKVTFYRDFEDFIKHDMDAVVLANYANEHAPFAVRCLRAGKHVFSEVLPAQNMKEAIELVEAVKSSGKVYAYGENYCYMPGTCEMKKLYCQGEIGEIEYAEAEYIHNCEPIWANITYGDKDHWRNNMYATFYCTHSLGPIIHITGLRPVSVVGFEGRINERGLRTGVKSGSYGIEMVTLENGAVIKSIHGGLYKNSIWYCIYGGKGRMETARFDAKAGDIRRLYVNADEYSGQYEGEKLVSYEPVQRFDDKAAAFGHGGSDFYSMYNFVEKALGNEKADTIDVYEALDMFLPGMFAYRSILQGGISVEIPDIRKDVDREKYRNDTMCTDPKAAGNMYIPPYSKGTPQIDDNVYENMKNIWSQKLKEGGTYLTNVFEQGKMTKR